MANKLSLLAEEDIEILSEVTPKRRFITKSTIIDKFTIKRDRVELTPSVCDVCAIDIAIVNKFHGWNGVPDDAKEGIKKALAEHKKVVHTSAEQLIVDEDQMPKSWLGNRAGV